MPSQGSPSATQESTSSSLLARAKARDPLAWQRLSALYGPLVYRWSRHFGLQAADAADVVQEVFRSVAGGIGDFQKQRPTDSFRGWLWTITRNKVRDHFRRHAARPDAAGGSAAQQMLDDLAATPADREPSGSFNSPTYLARQALDIIRTDFEERTFQAFWRSTIDGQPAAQIARELSMTEAAVYQAKSRVLRRLRTELAGLD